MNRRTYKDIDMMKKSDNQVEMLRMLFNSHCWTMLNMDVKKQVVIWYDKVNMETVVEWE
jgi:hypothetical protein